MRTILFKKSFFNYKANFKLLHKMRIKGSLISMTQIINWQSKALKEVQEKFIYK